MLVLMDQRTVHHQRQIPFVCRAQPYHRLLQSHLVALSAVAGLQLGERVAVVVGNVPDALYSSRGPSY
jgi:hypothetical protein